MNSHHRAFTAHVPDTRIKRFPQLEPESDAAAGTPVTSAALAEQRRQMEEDLAALRESEENLRAYEAHLRAQQEQFEASRASDQGATPIPGMSSFSPFSPDELTLQAAWEKVIRARELLEAEQAHLRDDRLQMKEEFAALKRRETAVKLREEAVAARELALNVSGGRHAGLPQATPATTAFSSMTKFTLAPFNLARSVLRGSK